MKKKYKKGLEHKKKVVAHIIKQISGNFDELEELLPEFVIVGTGVIYCYEPSSRTFINIERGTTAFVVDYSTNDRAMIYTCTNQIVEIDIDELEPLGFA